MELKMSSNLFTWQWLHNRNYFDLNNNSALKLHCSDEKMLTLCIKTESGERIITCPDVPPLITIEEDEEELVSSTISSTPTNNVVLRSAWKNNFKGEQDPLKELQGLAKIVAQFNSALNPEPPNNHTQIKMEKVTNDVSNHNQEFMAQTERDENIKTENIPDLENLPIKTEVERKRKPAPKSKNALKNRKGRVITTIKKKKIILCKLCFAQVPTLPLLVVHLDRQHNIRVQGPPRVVDELDEKEDLKNTSKLLKAIENKPRTVEVLSETEESDSGSASSSSDSDEVQDSSSDESDSSSISIFRCQEESYLKLKSRMVKVLDMREIRDQRRNAVFIQDPKSQMEINNTTKCDICWIEFSGDELLDPLILEHMRQHEDGQFKVCPHCGMCFLYEHYLEKHLEDLRVPVVPYHFTQPETQDLLYLSHFCPVSGCGAEFGNRQCLLFHRTNVHDHLHRCPTCEKSFVLYSKLRSHIERAHNYDKRELPCPVPLCDKSFFSRKGISSHMVRAHSKEEKEKWFIPIKSEKNNRPPPQISQPHINHRAPQTFWTLKNSQTVKRLVRRAKLKKLKIAGKRHKEPEPLLPPRASLSQPKVEQPCPPKSVTMARLSTTSSSSEVVAPSLKKGEPRPLTSYFSLPPKTDLVDITQRNRQRHGHFACVCWYCSRSFRTVEDRNMHLASVHNIDMTLGRPHSCPVPNCSYSYSRGGSMFVHIRQCHSPSVEMKLWNKALEEDRAAEELRNLGQTQPPVNVPFPNTIEPDTTESYSDEEELEQKPVIQPPVRRIIRRTPITTKRKKILLKRGGKYTSWRAPSGQRSIVIRKILSNFKFGSRLYCPECPLNKRKSFMTVYSLHRHLALMHPSSEILKNPGSVKIEVLSNQSGSISKSRQPSSSDTSTFSSDDEEQELDPTSKPESSNSDQDDNTKEVDPSTRNKSNSDDDEYEEVDPLLKRDDPPPPLPVVPASDIITLRSSPETLVSLRQLFTVSNRFKPRYPKDTRMTCPLCPQEKTFWSAHNVQRHFLVVHKGSEYLHKSKLDAFIQTQIKENENRGVQFTEGVKFEITERRTTSGRQIGKTLLPPRNTRRSLKREPEADQIKEETSTLLSSDESDMEVAPPPKPEEEACDEATPGPSQSESGAATIYKSEYIKVKIEPEEPPLQDEESQTVAMSNQSDIIKAEPPSPKPEGKESQDVLAANMQKVIQAYWADGGPRSTKAFKRFKLSGGRFFCPHCPIGIGTPPSFGSKLQLLVHLSKCNPSLLSPKHDEAKVPVVVVKQETAADSDDDLFIRKTTTKRKRRHPVEVVKHEIKEEDDSDDDDLKDLFIPIKKRSRKKKAPNPKHNPTATSSQHKAFKQVSSSKSNEF